MLSVPRTGGLWGPGCGEVRRENIFSPNQKLQIGLRDFQQGEPPRFCIESQTRRVWLPQFLETKLQTDTDNSSQVSFQSEQFAANCNLHYQTYYSFSLVLAINTIVRDSRHISISTFPTLANLVIFQASPHSIADMEFVINFTPADFQAKNFTPSISPNLRPVDALAEKHHWLTHGQLEIKRC